MQNTVTISVTAERASTDSTISTEISVSVRDWNRSFCRNKNRVRKSVEDIVKQRIGFEWNLISFKVCD